jgi:ribosomal protein L11 methyltransferase
MDWIQVVIYTTSKGIEPVTGRLYRLGAAGVEIEDENDFNDFLEHNRQYWDYVDDALREKMAGETRVKVYLADNEQGAQTLADIKAGMLELRALDAAQEFGRLAVDLAKMSEEDWANNWKQYFKPITVGEKIMIKPEWEELPPEAQGRTVFTVNPGMTFGTGAHETTRLCIEALERNVGEGSLVLDLGCGSGILSIIALLLGAAHAVAVDIDPIAQATAYENARLNGIGKDRYTVLTGDVITDGSLRAAISAQSYDVVVANIVADVIIALAPFVPPLLKEGGAFICSGIISQRRDEVAAALRENGLEPGGFYEEKGWAAIVCSRR